MFLSRGFPGEVKLLKMFLQSVIRHIQIPRGCSCEINIPGAGEIWWRFGTDVPELVREELSGWICTSLVQKLFYRNCDGKVLDVGALILQCGGG